MNVNNLSSFAASLKEEMLDIIAKKTELRDKLRASNQIALKKLDKSQNTLKALNQESIVLNTKIPNTLNKINEIKLSAAKNKQQINAFNPNKNQPEKILAGNWRNQNDNFFLEIKILLLFFKK